MICRTILAAFGCRVTSNHTTVAGLAYNQEREQEIEGHRRHRAHIDGGYRLSVISKKRFPALRRRLRRPRHIFRYCRLGDFEPEHQQFAMDPGSAPQWVFPAHPLDQITQATINLREDLTVQNTRLSLDTMYGFIREYLGYAKSTGATAVAAE